jgi:MerR family transcriptional regulator, thiopeptide resistance regulator
MLTVSKLARRCGLSRSTLLYYESIGLLKPVSRSAAGYRRYGEKDLRRLQQVCAYRDAGLKLEDIRALLDRPEDDASSVLKRRLVELNAEIETLRNHQRAILKLLRNYDFCERTEMNTKEKWVSIMKAAGFNEADMHRWHVEFERSAPDEHQEFLEFLHIPKEEVVSIREWSRKGGGAQGRG